MDVSPAVEARILEEVAALERYFPRITGCRVVVEAPSRHHQHSQGFHVGIVLHVPGTEIVVNHEPSPRRTLSGMEAPERVKHLEPHPDHKDAYVSIRDAFAAARRRLEDYARVLRGDTKHRAEASEAV
jgi:ribosome-associated translation inhibitor RaiA